MQWTAFLISIVSLEKVLSDLRMCEGTFGCFTKETCTVGETSTDCPELVCTRYVNNKIEQSCEMRYGNDMTPLKIKRCDVGMKCIRDFCFARDETCDCYTMQDDKTYKLCEPPLSVAHRKGVSVSSLTKENLIKDGDAPLPSETSMARDLNLPPILLTLSFLTLY